MKYSYIQFKMETLERNRKVENNNMGDFFVSTLGLVVQFLATMYIPFGRYDWIPRISRG